MTGAGQRLGGHQAEHFAHHLDTDAKGFPLFALHQKFFAIAAQNQINAAIGLLDEGATVPFIARYRKEVTGGLDDTQLRNLAERLQYLRELIERKATILKSIDEQGKLTPELAAQIEALDNKTALEDVYLPYKPKRRTKAQIAGI